MTTQRHITTLAALRARPALRDLLLLSRL